jgi:hypothetical protein
VYFHRINVDLVQEICDAIHGSSLKPKQWSIDDAERLIIAGNFLKNAILEDTKCTQ